jgi:hypothetical protein
MSGIESYDVASNVCRALESGACPKCPGAAAAREQAYNVASQQDRGGRFVMNQQLLGNGEGGGGGWQAGAVHSCLN